MIEILFVCAGLISLFATFFVYAHLLETKKIKPHIPPRYTNRVKTQRGNFWDAETKKFYKWGELMKLKKQKENNND